jgi:hypothetical protein
MWFIPIQNYLLRVWLHLHILEVLLGRGIGLYLHRTAQNIKTRTYKHASGGIWTHNPSVRAAQEVRALGRAATGTGHITILYPEWADIFAIYLHQKISHKAKRYIYISRGSHVVVSCLTIRKMSCIFFEDQSPYKISVPCTSTLVSPPDRCGDL